jgi:uncharacterized protein
MSVAESQKLLLTNIRRYDSCLVAFSAGVDSSVVAKAAHLAIGEHAIAATAVSPSLADGELEAAVEIAGAIGIRHEIIETSEFEDPSYVANAPDRCYFCKTELYSRLAIVADRLGAKTILNGANADDAGDYRPGMRAADEREVQSPLADCGLTKSDVRALAKIWNLPVWDKPAMPCLASRVAYGEEVTPERLRMIDRAERFLRSNGLSTVRVRYHSGDMARIEVPSEALVKLAEQSLRIRLVAELQSIGFKYVTLDLQGFRSGSLNEVLPVETLTAATTQNLLPLPKGRD